MEPHRRYADIRELHLTAAAEPYLPIIHNRHLVKGNSTESLRRRSGPPHAGCERRLSAITAFTRSNASSNARHTVSMSLCVWA
jgi:hypothetical protein